MKRKVFALLLTMLMVLSLAGCGKFTCDMCKEEKSGKKYKTTILDEKVTLCKDCHDDLEELKDALKGLGD